MNNQFILKKITLIVFVIASIMKLDGQSSSSGNTYIDSATSFGIYNMNHSFLAGGAGVQPGIVSTFRKAVFGQLNFIGTATWSGAGDTAHVDGYVGSYKLGAFTFPIGDNGNYQPAAISASDTTNGTNAAYFNVSGTTAITSKLGGGNWPVLPTGGPFATTAMGAGVSAVDNTEYWDINGTVAAKITLTWDASSAISTLTGASLSKLSIVGWNTSTSKWEMIASTVDVTSILGGASSLTTGSITTNATLVPNTYSVYTLAAINTCPLTLTPAPTVTNTNDNSCSVDTAVINFKVRGMQPATSYQVSYRKDGAAYTAFTAYTSASDSFVKIINLGYGSYDSIRVRLASDTSCSVTIKGPLNVGAPICPEICGDGIDNDGNGFVDGMDPNASCPVPFTPFNPCTIGTIVSSYIGAPSTVSFYKTGTSNALTSMFTIPVGTETINGIALNPIDNYIYAFDDNFSRYMVKIDSAGRIKNLGYVANMPSPIGQYFVAGGCFDMSGIYYGLQRYTSTQKIYKININVSPPTALDSSALITGSGGDLIIDPITNKLYISNSISGTWSLQEVNFTTGALTTKIATNVTMGALSYYPATGKLRAYGSAIGTSNPQNSYYELDPIAGTFTLLGTSISATGADGTSALSACLEICGDGIDNNYDGFIDEGCCNVNLDSATAVGNNPTYCGGANGSIKLSKFAPGTGTVKLSYKKNGTLVGPTNINLATNSYTISNLGNGTYTEFVFADSAAGPGCKDTLISTIKISDSLVCIVDTVSCFATKDTFMVKKDGLSTYVWSISPSIPFTSLVDTAISIDFDTAAVGLYTIQVIKTNSCGSEVSIIKMYKKLCCPSYLFNSLANDQSICAGQTPTSIVGATPVLTPVKTPLYQWMSSTTSASAGFTNITGATAKDYSPAALSATTWYKRIVYIVGCPGDTSVPHKVTINNKVTLTPITFTPAVVCSGSTTSANCTPSAGGNIGTWYVISGPGTINSSTGILTTSGSTAIQVRYIHPGVLGSFCPDTQDITITPKPKPTVTPSATASSVCNGVSTKISANATGGTKPYSYSWSPSGTGDSFIVTPPTTTNYLLTVTDSNGCSVTGSKTVTVIGTSPLQAKLIASTSICSGQSIALGGGPTALGGSGGFTYAWSGVASTSPSPIVSPLVTTKYVITVTSAGCTATDSVTITVNTKPTLNMTATPPSICNGQSTKIKSGAVGITSLTYSWTPSGTGDSFVSTPSSTTNYMLTVTDANNCTVSGSVTVTVTGTSPLQINLISSPSTVCSGSAVSLTASSTGGSGAGTYSYAWSNGAIGTTSTVTPTYFKDTTFTYSVTVTSVGCTATNTVTVNVKSKPTITVTAAPSPICAGQTSSITTTVVGGNGSMSYSWNSGSGPGFTTPILNATTGYSVTVTDINNCTATGSATVTVVGTSKLQAIAGNASTICSGTNVTLGGLGTGASATASGGSGTGTYSYLWSNGDTTANPIVTPSITTTYTVTVSSAGCTASSSVTITVNKKPVVTVIASPPNLCAGNTTNISTTVTGSTATPFTYSWNSGSGVGFTTAALNSTTTYNVTVTDINNCTSTGTITVTVTGTSPIVANAGSASTICSGTNVTLGGLGTGASATASGGSGTGTYSYLWSNGDTTANPIVTPSITTTYTVTVTSAGCTASSTVTINVNKKPIVVVNSSPDTVCAGSTSNISTSTSGSTATPFSYSWNSGSGIAFTSAPLNSTSTYNVTVTDINNCTGTGTKTVVVNPKPIANVTTPIQSLCVLSSGGSTNLNSSLGIGETGLWTLVSKPSGSPAITISTPTATSTNVSTFIPSSSPYTFNWTVTKGSCVSTPASMTINTSETPLVTLVHVDTACLNFSKTLTANVTSVGAPGYSWKQGSLASSPIASTLSTNIIPTINTKFYFTASLGACNAIDSMDLYVSGKPDAIDDLTTCLTNNAGTTSTYNIPTTIGANDNVGQIIKGGMTYEIVKVAKGTASISGNTLTYTSINNGMLADTITYRIYSIFCPNNADTAQVCIALPYVNKPPVAIDDTAIARGNTPVKIMVKANDSDKESSKPSLTITQLTNPTRGVIDSINSTTGAVYYKSNSNLYAGLDSFTYQLCDTGMPVKCDTATVLIILTPQPPDTLLTKVQVNAVITSGTPITKDPNSSLLIVLEQPKYNSGTATINPTNGVVTFTANDTPFIGQDTIMRRVCATTAGITICDTSYIFIDNPPINDTLRATTPMNTATTFPKLIPYIFEGGNPTITKSPTLTINPDGTIKYTPPTGFIGIDTARLTRCDNAVPPNCVTTVYIVTVTPKFVNDTVATYKGIPVTGGTPIVLGPGKSKTITTSGPSNGTIVMNPNGTFVYTPNPNFIGKDTVKRKICILDSASMITLCDSTITIIIVNPKPVDTFIITQLNTPLFNAGVPILKLPGQSTTTTITGPKNGTAQLNPDGTVFYVPKSDFIGLDTITRKVCTYDSLTLTTKCDSSRIIIEVKPNSKPDVEITFVNTPVSSNLNTNDKVLPGTTYGSPSPLTGNPSTSLPTVNSNGTYTFTSAVPGIYQFNVPVCPPGVSINCPVQLLTITVLDPKSNTNKPVASTDYASVQEQGLVEIITLANDKAGNPSNALVPKTVKITELPKNGTASVDSLTGNITYVPNPGFYGKDTLKYQVCDNGTPPNCASAYQIIDVMSKYAPNSTQAADDYNSGEFNKPQTGNVKTNDTDPENNPQIVQAKTSSIAGKGTLVLRKDGSYLFTPDSTFSGPVEFEYTICDSNAMPIACAKAILHIIVMSLKPTTNPDVNVTNVNVLVAGNLKTNDNVLPGTLYGSPTPIPGNPDTSKPVINPDGTYTFKSSKPGVYQFSVPVCPPGQTINCPTELLTITVLDPNSTTNKPVLNTDIASTKESTPVTLNTLANDLSGNTNTILVPNTVKVIEQPKNGTTKVDTVTGKITYTPNPGFVGKDTLKYQVCDNATPPNCGTAYQIIDVLKSTALNTTVAADDYNSGTNSSPISGNVKLNDSDPEGNTQTVTTQNMTIAGKGTIVLNADGTYTFTPIPGFVGTVDIPYTTCDNGIPQACATATLHILVNQTKLVTNPDVNTTFVNVPVSGNVSTNDNVPVGTKYGSPVANSGNPTNELPVVNPDGTYTFTPTKPGVYTFNISVCPPGQTTNCPTELLTITVLDKDSSNNKPVANTDLGISKGKPVTLFTLSNDRSGNANTSLVPSSVTITIPPKNGTAVVDPVTGNITYTPKPGFKGKDTLTYRVCDNAIPPNCATAIQIITVLDSNSVNITSATDDYAFTDEGKPVSGNVLTNDQDPEGNKQTVTPQNITIPGKGTFVLNADGTYTFTPATGFNGPIDFEYTVCDNGVPVACAKATLHILVKELPLEEANIPNYISPNGDGKNDIFVLPNSIMNKYPNAKVSIYNRWGNIVWRSTGKYNNDWHGQLEGSSNTVPDGVYYYILELEDKFRKTKSGFIEIMRN